jgi:hypothetical protein
VIPLFVRPRRGSVVLLDDVDLTARSHHDAANVAQPVAVAASLIRVHITELSLFQKGRR